MDMDENYLISWIEKRIRILFESGLVLGFFGASKISIVLRPRSPGNKGTDRVERIIKNFIDIITDDAEFVKSQLKLMEGSDEPRQNSSQNCRTGLTPEDNEITDKQLRTIMHNVAAFGLPYLEPDAVNTESYSTALQAIHYRLDKDTAYHATADLDDEMEYDGPRTIVDTMIRVWNALQLSEDIQKTFTAAATESGEANEDPDGGNERLGNSINNFLQSVAEMNNTFAEHAECEDLRNKLKKMEDDVKSDAQKQKDLKEEARDQFLYIRYTVSVACTIVKAAKYFTNISNKELGIRTGLNGITCLIGAYGRNSRNLDAIVTRFCLQDFAILPHLSDESIYLNYSDCWKFLWNAAKCGYKIILVEFPIVKAAVKIMSRKDETRKEAILIHKYASAFVVSMLEDKVDLSSITQRQVKSEADGNIVTPKRFNKLLMQLRVGLRKPVNKIVKEIRSGTLNSQTGTQQLIELPKEWFNRRVAVDFNFTYGDLDSRHKNDCMQNAFEVASSAIASKTAVELVDCVHDWLTFDKETPTEFALEQLRVLAECISHATTDDDIFIKLCNSTPARPTSVLEKLITFRKTGDKDDVNNGVEHSLLNLIYAEHKRKKMSLEIKERIEELDKIIQLSKQRNKVHDLDEVKHRERILKQLVRHGHVRLRCMESNLVTVAVKRLLAHESGQEIQLKHQSTLLHFIDAFIIAAVDDEERKYHVEPIMRQRGNILRVTAKLITNAAEIVNGISEGPESYDTTALHIIGAGCPLYNELIHKFQWHDFQDFYDVERNENKSTVHGMENKADITNSPSFLFIRDALGAVHRSLLVRRTTLRRAAGGKHAETVNKTIVKAVMAMLNASSTSGISHGKVRAEMQKDAEGGSFVATLGTINEPGRPNLLCSHEDLAKIKPQDVEFERNNILRAAYLVYLASKDKSSLTVARLETLSVVEEAINGCGYVVKEENHAEQQRKEMEIKEKEHEELLTGQTLGSDHEGIDNRLLRGTITSTAKAAIQNDFGLAVYGVYLEVSPINRRIPKYQVPYQIDYDGYAEVFGAGGVLALRILLTNPPTKREIMNKLKCHLELLMKSSKPLRMRKSRKSVMELTGLSGARGLFHSTGHEEHRNALETFVNWYDEWTDKNAPPLISLHSEFEDCDGTTIPGRDFLIGQSLPADFFHAEQQVELTGHSIRRLFELRSHGNTSVKSSYVLVRIQLRGNRLVQAIFNNVTSVESVISRLRDIDPFVVSVKWNTSLTKEANSIGEIGSFTVYGDAEYDEED
ncbi:hypothetical protein PRIPAC_71813 [Pristionchus pacificus]|uniref:Uncharacterized protein n=1 Tax=Pristionchus pacificus TaxID=54126 RepID=A0A2A6CFY0_PRIPA|nr:hypothetical protein PRIPAC_71813 [Pristionchus pacificus]|eukprot:PDM77135.1 hypothetical protein PRIPAC_43047 [Pristionchus pacificus]